MQKEEKEEVIILGYGFFVSFKKFKRGVPEIEEMFEELYKQTGISLDYHILENVKFLISIFGLKL